MTNREKLKQLTKDVFLLSEAEFRFDLIRDDVMTWDSLGTVSIAVGVQETFGYHMTPDEATHLGGIADIIRILESKGIRFDE